MCVKAAAAHNSCIFKPSAGEILKTSVLESPKPAAVASNKIYLPFLFFCQNHNSVQGGLCIIWISVTSALILTIISGGKG